MSRHRKTPPLFEVMRDPDRFGSRAAQRTATPPAQTQPPAPVAPSAPPSQSPKPTESQTRPAPIRQPAPNGYGQPTPVAAPSRPAPSRTPADRAGGDGEPGLWEQWAQGGSIRIPVPAALIGAAVVLVVVLLTWIIGYNVGHGSGREEVLSRMADPSLDPAAAGVSDPLSGDWASTRPGDSDRRNSADQRDRPGAPPDRRADAQQRGHAVIPDRDPRRPGYNYLHVARLNMEDAERAARFLTRNGVPAVAVPTGRVDPRDPAAKDRIWMVFVAEGIPSERYRRMRAERDALESQVKRLGRLWKQQERGPTDFSDAYFQLFR